MTIILKQAIRILRPHEYEKLREEFNPNHKLIFDGLFFTGLKSSEFWEFLDNPQRYDSITRTIEVPSPPTRRKIKQDSRTIYLTFLGDRVIKDIINTSGFGAISRQAWGADVKRAANKAGIGIEGISPKMTRKTWTYWLMSVFPDDTFRIADSMGLDANLLRSEYLTTPFDEEEIERIKWYLQGWGGRRTIIEFGRNI